MRKDSKMAEQKFRPYFVKMLCENCGGEMNVVMTESSVETNPRQYLHICDQCGRSAMFSKSYPCTEYVPEEFIVENDEEIASE